MCLTEESFAAEAAGFIIGKRDGKNMIRSNVNGTVESLVLDGKKFIYESPALKAVLGQGLFGHLCRVAEWCQGSGVAAGGNGGPPQVLRQVSLSLMLIELKPVIRNR